MKIIKIYFLIILFLSLTVLTFAQDTSPIGFWEGLDDLGRRVVLDIGQRNWNMWINESFFGSGTYRVTDRFTHLVLTSGREYGAFFNTVGDSLAIQRFESDNVFFLDRSTITLNQTASSPSRQPSPSATNDILSFLIGYNYSFGMPFGLTLGVSRFYFSGNMNFPGYFTNGFTEMGGTPYYSAIAGETTVAGFQISVGFTINLYGDNLKLPVGIGINLTDEYQYFHGINEGWYAKNGGMNDDNAKLIIEVGLQLSLIDFLYLRSMYRLIGFSKSGFTLGAGFVF